MKYESQFAHKTFFLLNWRKGIYAGVFVYPLQAFRV